MSASNNAPDDELELNILFDGDDPCGGTFSVKISRNVKVDQLEDAIRAAYKQKTLESIGRLNLFKANMTDEELGHLKLSDMMMLTMRQKVASFWPPGSTVDDDLIHVVVQLRKPPTNTEQRTAAPPAEDELRELTDGFKKAQLLFVEGLEGRSSATAAEPKNFRQQQETDNHIKNGRPAEHTGPPIVLYHPVFGRFLRNLRSSDPIPSAMYTHTTTYFPTSQQLYEQEFGRDQSSHANLGELLGGLLSKTSKHRVEPDGMSLGHDGAPCIIMEMKNEIGSGKSDPSIQAAQSYSRSWRDPSHLLERCCCPSILIAIAGPWMSILGAVFLDRPVIQPLTDYLWVGHNPAKPSDLRYVARVFHCISLARKELEDFYKNPPTLPDNPGRFFPYITCYTDSAGHRVDFAYLKNLGDKDPNESVFLATTTRGQEPPKSIVVKFVQSYNSDAHKLLAEAGLAPELLYDGTAHPEDQPGPDHIMIVMEFINGVDLGRFLEYHAPECASADVDKALELLHAQDFVFGDLRNPNIMLVQDSDGTVTGAKLVDFDWCGRHSEGRYPLSMNPGIVWAKGAGPGELMDKRHDIEMRKKLRL